MVDNCFVEWGVLVVFFFGGGCVENIEQVEKCVEYHVTFGLRDFLKSQMGLGKRWRRRNIFFSSSVYTIVAKIVPLCTISSRQRRLGWLAYWPLPW